ncbi:MAG: type II and III secretion system protein, partial [Phycisphaeraceae bacterium]|nr:type II and III secretion system protein [Phycisphaeraceae bacterium]
TSVNASNNVATTSFAGYATAGTTITLTPHISEGDHLQLAYAIELSAFSGDGGEGIPPPRQTNAIESEVTVPDGHTIVVGGLNRKDFSETIQKFPLLGDIPLVKYLFSNRSKNQSENTLFVFLRPVILRGDSFEGLKYLSRLDREAAGLAEDLPASEPLLMP